MSARRRRNALLVCAAALVVAGVIVAIVTAGGGHRHRSSLGAGVQAHSRRDAPGTAAEVAVAARYLGLSSAQVRSRMRSGLTLGELAAATPGKSEAALIAALTAQRYHQLQSRPAAKRLSAAARERRLERLHRRFERQVQRLPGYADLSASARYLGSSVSKLRAELQSGETLAQIADATPGKSAAGLIDARVRSREAALEAAAASGAISQATVKSELKILRERVSREVQRRPPKS